MFLKKFVRTLDLLNTILGKIGSILFIGLVGLTVFEVITRRLLGPPTIWTYEMTTFIFAPLVLFALGYTYIENNHATIDIFYQKFSPEKKALLNVIMISLILLPSSIILFLDTWEFAAMSWQSLERTASAFNAPIYPVKTTMPIGFLFLILAAISQLLKNIYFLVKKENLLGD